MGSRRTPGRPPLPRADIIAKALEIVDGQGADALSMRTLARELGSSTATLYRHFENRTELVAEVVDHLFRHAVSGVGELSGMDWRQAYRQVATAAYHAMKNHRGALPLLLERVPSGPNAMLLRERCLAVLLENGFPPHFAARTYASLARYVLGFAIQTGGTGAGADTGALKAALSQTHPATAAVGDALPISLDEEFAFGLDLLIAGLAHRLDERDA